MSTKQNLLLEQGATIHYEVQLYDANNQPLQDSTSYVAAAQLRESWESNVAYSFVTSFVGGVLNMDMAANNSILIPPGNYQYDIILTVANTTIRLMEGIISVTPQITHG